MTCLKFHLVFVSFQNQLCSPILFCFLQIHFSCSSASYQVLTLTLVDQSHCSTLQCTWQSSESFICPNKSRKSNFTCPLVQKVLVFLSQSMFEIIQFCFPFSDKIVIVHTCPQTSYFLLCNPDNLFSVVTCETKVSSVFFVWLLKGSVQLSQSLQR